MKVAEKNNADAALSSWVAFPQPSVPYAGGVIESLHYAGGVIETLRYAGGVIDNSPTFERWVSDRRDCLVPKGRLTPTSRGSIQPSLRDSSSSPCTLPNVETLGYCRMSLRDKTDSTARSFRNSQNPSAL
jgi:hypothetical protein